MGRLEEVEKKQESKASQLEQETEDVEEKIEELDKKIDELEKAIRSLNDDDQVRASLERNLAEREQEKQQEQKNAKNLESQAEELSGELDEYEDINQNSRAEVSDLQGIEDVSDALSVIDQRDSWVSERRDSINELKNRLNKLG